MHNTNKLIPSIKILHVISHLKKGGAERQLSLLLSGSTYNHYVVTLHPNANIQSAGIKVINSLSFREVFRVVSLEIDRQGIDIVQLWLPDRLTIPAMIAAKFKRKKIISCDRRKPRDYGVFLLLDRIKYINHAVADIVIANYPFQSRSISLKKFLGIPKKSLFIPNGVENENKEFGLTKKPECILFVGRLVEQKRVSLLIRSLPELERVYGVSVLEIVGDGPMKNELISLVTTLNLQGRVIFHGEVTDWQRKFSKNQYIVMLPSTSEGMSNTLFEAVSSGFYTVSTSSRELEEIQRDWQVKLPKIHGRGVDGIVDALSDFAEMDLVEISATTVALGKEVSNYSVPNMVLKYDESYAQLLAC